jgi:hypothetical protein
MENMEYKECNEHDNANDLLQARQSGDPSLY